MTNATFSMQMSLDQFECIFAFAMALLGIEAFRFLYCRVNSALPSFFLLLLLSIGIPSLFKTGFHKMATQKFTEKGIETRKYYDLVPFEDGSWYQEEIKKNGKSMYTVQYEESWNRIRKVSVSNEKCMCISESDMQRDQEFSKPVYIYSRNEIGFLYMEDRRVLFPDKTETKQNTYLPTPAPSLPRR